MTDKEIKKIDPKLDTDSIFSDFEASDRYVSSKRSDWDDKENLFFARQADAISDDETKSQIHDPRLSTYIIERAGRQIFTFPRGKTKALGKGNRGKSMLMNLILDKYIFPNANGQFPFLTKLFLMQIYSNIYGSSFALTDWAVDKRRGYIGPDTYLIPIRDFFPQVGAISLQDSDYAQVSTLRTVKWLKERDEETWQDIDDALEKISVEDLKGTSRSEMSGDRQTTRYSEYYTDDAGKGDNKVIELITRYERDQWITFLPDYEQIIRVIENPHKNDKGKSNGLLPIVAKYNIPVLEDFFGLGEFERGETLQKSLDSLINLYFDGVKMSLFPPMQINPDGVTPSTIKLRPAAKWFVDRPNVDVQPTQISPRGMDTFVSSYQYLLGALQNSQGTSETNISSGTDTTMGKTPQALRMQSRRENTRDAMERFQMEQTVSQIVERFTNLMSSKMNTTLVLSLFDEEIDEIAAEFPDLTEIFTDGSGGKISIDKSNISGNRFIYQIEPGSMEKKDEELELENLSQMIRMVLNGAQIEPQSGQLVSPLLKIFENSGKKLDVAELFKRWVATSGIRDFDKIILDDNDYKGEAGMGGNPQNPTQPKMIDPTMIDALDQEMQSLQNSLGNNVR